jgi:hypothetical protein
LADKDFRVKNKLHVNGLNNASGVILATNNALDSHTNLPTQYGGTGTTTSPNSGQILYSSSGTTYAPTTLNTLDVKGATYSADAPSSPVVGQIWVESDTSSDSFDPNIIRRKTFTATAAQTVFTTDVEFIQGYEQVFFNGMLLIRNSDYTTASNTNVTLAAGAAAGDIVEVVSITNLNSINTATTTTNTFTGNQIIDIPNSTSVALKINAGGVGSDGIVMDRPGEAIGPIGRRFNGTYAVPTQVLANQRESYIIGASYGTTTFNNNAAINLYAAEDQTDTARGSYITFDTTNLLSVGRSEKMRIMANGKVTIGSSSIFTTTTPTTAKLTVISDSTASDVDTNAFISLRNKNYANSTTVVGGILSDTYRDIADPHYSAGMWFNREPYSGNASSSGSISFGTEYNVSSSALPKERLKILSNASNVGVISIQSGGTLNFQNPVNTGNGSIYCPGGGSLTLLAYNQPGITLYEDSEIQFRTGSGTDRMRLTSVGLLVGYTSSQGAYKLQVNSQIFATSSSIATSDGRYKENVNTITSGLNIVDSLRPVSFTWKDHPVHNFVAGKTVGFIAQEVKEALSEYDWVDNIIKTNTSDAILDEEGNEVTPSEEFLGIAESNIIPLLVAAVKELKTRVETLEANNV